MRSLYLAIILAFPILLIAQNDAPFQSDTVDLDDYTLLIDSFLEEGDTIVTVDTLFNNEAEQKLYSIIGVGDIMLGTDFPSTKYLPANDARGVMAGVIDVLPLADVTFGNLEGSFAYPDAELGKKCKDTTKCYAFRMPPRYAPRLQEAGFDLLSISNNHGGDFGNEGRATTLQLLDSLGIGAAGSLVRKLAIIERNGVKYGLLAFSPNRGTVRINEYETAKALLKELDRKVDIIIVSFHGGAEGTDHQHVTKETEYYYGEDRGNVHEFAHLVIDHGADIVFGHGPHVVRAAELYNNRFIIYSLGNFATYARFNVSGVKGYAPIVKVFTDEQGQFVKAEVISAIQKGEGGPQIDALHRAYNKIAELTDADFPDTPLEFVGNGLILKKK